jgi:hypothetical protein
LLSAVPGDESPGYVREPLRGRLSSNSEVGRPRQRLVRPHQRFRSRPRRTRRGCRRLVASGSGRVEAPASGDIRRTGRAAAVDSGPGVQGGIMTSAIQAARFWHPSGMRGDSSGVPGVSLRSTPGYGLRSLRDGMPKPKINALANNDAWITGRYGRMCR